MRRPDDLNFGLDPRPFLDLFRDSLEKIAGAEEQVQAARAEWAGLLADPKTPQEKQMKASRKYIRAVALYQRSVDEHNKKNPDSRKDIDKNILDFGQDPAEAGSSFEGYRVTKQTEERKIRQVRKVGQPLDRAALLKTDPNGKKVDVADDDVLALDTRPVVQRCYDLLDEDLRSGKKPSGHILKPETVLELVKMLETKIITRKNGSLPTGRQIGKAARVEMLTIVLERSRELLAPALAAIFAPQPRVPNAAPLNFAQLQPLPINALPDPAQHEQQKRIFAALDLLPPNGRIEDVSIGMLQKKLAELGPKHAKVTEFFGLTIIPPAKRDSLLALISSQHHAEESYRKIGEKCDEINANRAKGVDAKGAAGEAQKALDALHAVEDGNERLSKMPAEAKEFGVSSVAAVEAAHLILDEKFDPTAPHALDDKISKPVTDASSSPDTPAVAKAAQAAFRQGVNLTSQHFTNSPKSNLMTVAALSSFAAARHILAMTPGVLAAANFAQGGVEGGGLSTAVVNAINLIIAEAPVRSRIAQSVREAARKAKNRASVTADLASPDLKVQKNAQIFVAKVAVLAGAIFSVLRRSNMDFLVAEEITTVLCDYYIQNGAINEDIIRAEMQRINGWDLIPLRRQNNILNTAGTLVQVARTGFGIVEGAAESRAAILNAQTTAAAEIKSLGFSEGLSAKIAENLHNRFAAQGEAAITEANMRTAIDEEILRANHAIAQICNTTITQNLGVAGVIPVADQAIFDQCLRQVAQEYKNTGKAPTLEGVTETLNRIFASRAPAPAPAWLGAIAGGGGIPAFANIIVTRSNAVLGVAAVPQGNPAGIALAQAPGLIQVPVGAAIGDSARTVLGTYREIRSKAIQGAAKGVAQFAHLSPEKINAVGKVVEEKIAAGDHLDQVAAAATEILPIGEDIPASLAMSTVVAGDVALPGGPAPAMPQAAIRSAYNKSQPRIFMATAAAIGSGVAAATIKAGLPGGAAKLASDAATNAFLTHGFEPARIRQAIGGALDPTVNLMTETLFVQSTAENLSFPNGVVVPPELLNAIRDKIVSRYLETGEMTPAIATSVRDEVIAQHNLAHPQALVAVPAAGVLAALMNPLVRALTNLDLGLAQGTPQELIDRIREQILNYCLAHGSANLDAAVAFQIVTQEVNRHNAVPGAAPVVAPNVPDLIGLPATFGRVPAVRNPSTVVDVSDKVKEKLYRAAYKGYATTAGLQVIKKAEKDHAAAEQKDAKKAPNFREVAATVFIGALSDGACSLAQAQELSKQLTAYYVEHGNFDRMNFGRVVAAVLPAAAVDDQGRIAKRIEKAARTAMNISESADAIAAGTAVAAAVFPVYDSPEKAGVLAGLIAKVRRKGNSPAAVSSASAYAEGVSAKAKLLSTHFAVGAAGAVGVANQIFEYVVVQGFPAYVNGLVLTATLDAMRDRLRDVLAYAETGQNYATLPANSPTQQTIIFVAEQTRTAINNLAQQMQADLANPVNQTAALTRIAKTASTVSAACLAARKLGLSDAAITRIRQGLALNPQTADQKDDKILLANIETALAYHCAEECKDTVNTIAIRVPARPMAPLNFGHRAIQADAAGQAVVVAPPPGQATFTAAEIDEQASTAYARAKDAFYRAATWPDQIPHHLVKAYAEVVGRLASVNFYDRAIKDGRFADSDEFLKASKNAKAHSSAAVKAVRNLKGHPDVVALAAPDAPLPPVPSMVHNSKVLDIARAARAGALIQVGIKAGREVVVAGQPTPADRAAAAVEQVLREAIGQGYAISTDPARAGEMVRDVINKSATPAEAGALVGSMFSIVPAINQAVAAVTTHFVADGVPDAQKCQAIADATSATAISEDRELPSGLSEEQLRAFAADEELRRKKLQVAEERCGAMELEDELPADEMGISDGMKEYHLDRDVNLNAGKAGEWTITFPSEDGMPPEPTKLENMEELKETVELMKQCDGFVDAATLRIAIDQFNEGYRPAERTGLSLKLFGQVGGRIPKDAITVKSDGGISVSLKGLSRKEIVSLVKIWAQASKLAKENSLHRPIEPEAPRSGRVLGG